MAALMVILVLLSVVVTGLLGFQNRGTRKGSRMSWYAVATICAVVGLFGLA